MFREMMRKKQELSKEECIDILKNEHRGVLSVLGDDSYPYGLPINHYYNDDDGCIYFHGARRGHRVDAVKRCDKVSFCVYDEGFRREGEWALNIKSVIVFGRIEIIDDIDTVIYVSRRLCYKFTNDEKYIDSEIERSARSTLLMKLIPEHITGKIVNEA